MGISPDFEYSITDKESLAYIHRKTSETDIYFVANLTGYETRLKALFRVGGKVPQLWNPVNGNIHTVDEYEVRELILASGEIS